MSLSWENVHKTLHKLPGVHAVHSSKLQISKLCLYFTVYIYLENAKVQSTDCVVATFNFQVEKLTGYIQFSFRVN